MFLVILRMIFLLLQHIEHIRKYFYYFVFSACECVVYQSYGRSQGTFTSPNFPQIYPPNINCILYTFIGDLDEIVELTFLEFDLNVPITNK